MMLRVSLATVAEAAGVSVATASRALSGRGDLSAATRRRVHAAAREVGYERRADAGGRPSGASGLVDLVLGRFHTPYSNEVTAGAHLAAAAAGYDLVLTQERESGDDWPQRVSRRGSAGVVLGLISPTASQLRALADTGTPVVLVDPPGETAHDLPSVRTTDRDGAVSAAGHLAARGATRFAIVTGSPPFRYGRARRDGFVEAVRGIRPAAEISEVPAAWRAPEARDAILPLLRGLPRGERLGVFACNDELALGVYAAAAAAGRRIPEDVLVVGFDDMPPARWMTPPLTTVHQPIREMASAAVTALAEAAAGAPLPARPIVLPTRLVERGSA